MPAERTYKTRAIVLHARNLGEADKIFTLLTGERGKVDAVAKGVRRQKSPLAGRLEFGSEVALTMHRGRNLDVITSAEPLSSRWASLVQPAAFAAASVLLEVVDAFCEPDLAMPDVYALLDGALGALAAAPEAAAIVPRFELRLLDALGLCPPLGECVHCGADLAGGRAWADVHACGLSCAACRPQGVEALVLESEDVRSFRAVGTPRGGGASLHATRAAARAIDAFVTHHLGKRPKSAKFLDELAARPA